MRIKSTLKLKHDTENTLWHGIPRENGKGLRSENRPVLVKEICPPNFAVDSFSIISPSQLSKWRCIVRAMVNS